MTCELCWALLVASIIYFVRIDRSLNILRRDHQYLVSQLKKWGIINPDAK